MMRCQATLTSSVALLKRIAGALGLRAGAIRVAAGAGLRMRRDGIHD
jgi:hypothetical protein